MPLPSTQQYAPWIDDPDPPEEPMTQAQLDRMVRGLIKLKAKKAAEAAKDGPEPTKE